MKNTLSKVFIFALGAAAGSLVTWKFVKTKYEQIANADIADVKEYYAEKYGEGSKSEDEPQDEEDEEEEDEEFDEYEAELKANGYTSAATEGVKAVSKKPYVIPPEDFGDCDYDMETLYYYADGVLADDQGNCIEDVDDVVGTDSLNHFGEYEDDSVHVRNERYKTDYEILRDPEKYSDVINRNPHPTEDE